MHSTFEWTSAFETGLQEIDDQHRHLVGHLNAAGDAVSSSRDVTADEVEVLNAQLREYAVYHFAAEEQLMAAEGVAVAHRERHHREHRFMSVGAAARMPEMASSRSLIRAADDAMYEAKEAGRDRVVSKP